MERQRDGNVRGPHKPRAPQASRSKPAKPAKTSSPSTFFACQHDASTNSRLSRIARTDHGAIHDVLEPISHSMNGSSEPPRSGCGDCELRSMHSSWLRVDGDEMHDGASRCDLPCEGYWKEGRIFSPNRARRRDKVQGPATVTSIRSHRARP